MTSLLTTPQAADALNVSRSWLEKAVAARLVPHTRVGRLVRFSEQDLRDIVAAGRTEPVQTGKRRAS